MTRVTLVVNRHDAASETFQRALAQTLVDAGYATTVHALQPGSIPGGPAPAWDRTVGLPPLRPTRAAAVLKRLLAGEHAMALAARRAVARFGATSRAARAAVTAGPILATRPDVVHLGFSGLAVALRDVLDLLDDARLVVSCRGTDELVRPLLDPARAAGLVAVLERMDAIHAVCDAVADSVIARGADPDRVTVVRPAVDLGVWSPRPATVPSGGPDLVAVARLHWAKGIEDLLAAVARARSERPELRLALLGDGPHLDAVRLRVERTGLADAVDLLGAVPHEVVRERVSAARLFVSASLSEGISNGVLEAMALGVPVISTAVGGMGEVITDGRDGWLVPAGRPDLLGDAIGAALADTAALDRVAAAGRRRVEDAFGRERQADEVRALYGRVTATTPRRSTRDAPGQEGTP